MFRKISICLTILFIAVFSTQAVFAGSINQHEQRVINEAAGYFYFEGDSYKVPGNYLNRLKAYLAGDGIDLTSEQADEAIFIMHKNVETAISEGYIHKAKGKDQEGSQGSEAVQEVYEPVTLLKKEDTSLELIYGVVGAVLAVFIAFCLIRYKKRGLRYCMPAIFAIIISAGLLAAGNPLEQNFVLPVKSAVEQGNPENMDLLQLNGITFPKSGERYATLSCPEIGLAVPVYYGYSKDILKNGGGQSAGSYIGTGGNVVIEAYGATYFEPLNHLTKDDLITVTTTYGVFTYQLADDDDEGESLVLHPQGALKGDKTDAASVVCSKVSGPIIEVAHE